MKAWLKALGLKLEEIGLTALGTYLQGKAKQ